MEVSKEHDQIMDMESFTFSHFHFFIPPSICMAAGPGHLPDLPLLATFAAGSFVMRGAGCTINDMWDKNIDNKVQTSL